MEKSNDPMSNSKDELKPCPFCGKEVDINEDMDAITCVDTEGGCGFYYNIEGDLKDTIKSWNTRQSPTLACLDEKELSNQIDQACLNYQQYLNHCKLRDSHPAESMSSYVIGYLKRKAIIKSPPPIANEQPMSNEKDVEELAKQLAWLTAGRLDDTYIEQMKQPARKLIEQGYRKSPTPIESWHGDINSHTTQTHIPVIQKHNETPIGIQCEIKPTLACLDEKVKILKNEQLVSDPIKGDCFRACVTSLLGLPNTDKFPDAGDKEWFIKWYNYLKEFGLNIHYEERACWRSGYWIASVKSQNFTDVTHAIIMHEQEVYFDPSPNKKYKSGENLLGKDIVLGGWYFEVEDFSKLCSKFGSPPPIAVVWPEPKECKCSLIPCECNADAWNFCLDACKKAVKEAYGR